MSLIKHNFPILEYDTEQKASIMPARKNSKCFPERAIFAFLGNETEIYAQTFLSEGEK